MTQVNLKDCVAHPVTYAQSLMNQLEAAEARAAQNDALMAEAAQTISDLREQRDGLIRQLDKAFAKIAELAQQGEENPFILNGKQLEQAQVSQFEHVAPLDWRESNQ